MDSSVREEGGTSRLCSAGTYFISGVRAMRWRANGRRLPFVIESRSNVHDSSSLCHSKRSMKHSCGLPKENVMALPSRRPTPTESAGSR
jgi:hypothetical protein